MPVVSASSGQSPICPQLEQHQQGPHVSSSRLHQCLQLPLPLTRAPCRRQLWAVLLCRDPSRSVRHHAEGSLLAPSCPRAPGRRCVCRLPYFAPLAPSMPGLPAQRPPHPPAQMLLWSCGPAAELRVVFPSCSILPPVFKAWTEGRSPNSLLSSSALGVSFPTGLSHPERCPGPCGQMAGAGRCLAAGYMATGIPTGVQPEATQAGEAVHTEGSRHPHGDSGGRCLHLLAPQAPHTGPPHAQGPGALAS